MSRVERTTNIDMSKYTAEQSLKMIRGLTIAVSNQAKMFAPVDTGRLRQSIEHKMIGPLEGEVFTPTEYAPFIEYGTRNMSAQPFMRPALDEMSKRAAEKWRQ